MHVDRLTTDRSGLKSSTTNTTDRVTSSVVTLDSAVTHSAELVTDSMVLLDPALTRTTELDTDSEVTLDPGARPFITAVRHLSQSQVVDLGADREHVRQVQDGGVGILAEGAAGHWNNRVARYRTEMAEKCSDQSLPFAGVEDIPAVLGLAPKEVHMVSKLQDLPVKLPFGNFCDKLLPTTVHQLQVNEVFTPDYFVALHNITAPPGVREDGSSYTEFTPNHLGARVSLPHTKFRLDRWRNYLIGYDSVEVCQCWGVGRAGT